MRVFRARPRKSDHRVRSGGGTWSARESLYSRNKRSYGLAVMTQASEAWDPGANPGSSFFLHPVMKERAISNPGNTGWPYRPESHPTWNGGGDVQTNFKKEDVTASARVAERHVRIEFRLRAKSSPRVKAPGSFFGWQHPKTPGTLDHSVDRPIRNREAVGAKPTGSIPSTGNQKDD